MTADLENPPGWILNPSSWKQRVPLVLWALIGFAAAAYLSLYQFYLVDTVWEPFFGEGSHRVLTSPISYLVPVPDAALGAFGYLIDALTGIIGGKKRWKTMPWMVLLFGFAAGPMGLVGVVLVILQPVLVGAWCTLCLFSAVISVGLISPSLDESLASLQYMKDEKARGRSLWRTFWGIGPSNVSPREQSKNVPRPHFNQIQLIVAAAGIWVMAAPGVLGYGGLAATNDWIVGPLVASFAVVALWEFMTAVKSVNLLLGSWLVITSLIFQTTAVGRLSSAMAGMVVVLVSLWPVAYRPEFYGGGWKALFKRT